ncbi:MAG: fibrobacter succinogenes major paralogous domain-containing protein [Bacteroidales bacterium]|nr:fibrobacter succinogenes major paralogous domain-containing protein [Bacteroidales bacterium]MCF8455513.1 fibrobacter succinogenes major paralogous domain-containing protein [Bacteroidales bacterium]
MKKIIYLLAVIYLFSMLPQKGEAQIIQLTFTGLNNNVNAPLDSIRVSNLTQGGDTLLIWPDTVLTQGASGLAETLEPQNRFSLRNEGSNPVTDQTTISLVIPQSDRLVVRTTDLLGRQQVLFDKVVTAGTHAFNFKPANNYFLILTAQWRKEITSLKIVNSASNTNAANELTHAGSVELKQSSPVHGSSGALPLKNSKSAFILSTGDQLLLEGYADNMYHSMLDTVQYYITYTFHFDAPSPCAGTPYINYGGEIYPTVQIGTQCWMAKNLNIGTYVESVSTGIDHSEASNNSIIEKYCINNDINNCTIYGGLYDWDEMMGYTTTEGTQGICPTGWHIPTDSEWCTMTIFLDPSVVCSSQQSGYFISGKMKEVGTAHWNSTNTGVTNSSGFTALPGGSRAVEGNFFFTLSTSLFWSSSEDSSTEAMLRKLTADDIFIIRNSQVKTRGISVRCLRDN